MEVAKQVHGNLSKVLERTGSVPPVTLALEAILDIFQLAQADLYVGSYSNWAYLVMALRLAESPDPSDPSDRFHRSVVVMNGNPSVPIDPYAVGQLVWDDPRQKLAAHVPALHAFRDASDLFPHMLLVTHWIGG